MVKLTEVQKKSLRDPVFEPYELDCISLSYKKYKLHYLAVLLNLRFNWTNVHYLPQT
jgi:hypothetical protein